MTTAGRLQVLVVDDDHATCAMLQDALDGDFGITCVSEPRRAADMVRRNGFHVILLDLLMPGMSGFDVLAQIRKFDQDLAVVIITGHPSVESAAASIDHHVTAYVQKPIDLEHLRSSLLRVAREKGILLDSPQKLLAQVGRKVRALRTEKGLSLRQLSRRSHLSPSLLSSIERAAASASLASLLRVATALGVRLRDLFDDI